MTCIARLKGLICLLRGYHLVEGVIVDDKSKRGSVYVLEPNKTYWYSYNFRNGCKTCGKLDFKDYEVIRVQLPSKENNE